jgi:hypothetical protein
VITNDTGLAPNPYWGTCTLAVCTPNHQGIRLQPGDWIAGFLNKARNYRIVYAMQVDERIHLNDYFYDPRFEAKKPDLKGSWMQRCGDNFYSQSGAGVWMQHRNRFHIGEGYLKKDTRRPYAFVGKRFCYFGAKGTPPAERFLSLVGGRGVRRHDNGLAREFLAWVADQQVGIHADPNDNPDLNLMS